MKEKVIVIGAGLAGLAAAFRLKNAGVNVTVYEADGRVGGRVMTERVDGYTIDGGAQFFSKGYANVNRLIEECNLTKDIVTASRTMAAVRNGKIVTFRFDRSYQTLTRGLFDLSDVLRLVSQLVRTTKLNRCPPLDDYSAWAALDTEDAEDWCNRKLGVRITENVLESMTHHEIAGTSLALIKVYLAAIEKGSGFFTLKGGLQQLPEKLAKGLDIRLNSNVDQIHVNDESVEVSVQGETVRAKHVVLATPAPVARRLYTQAEGIEENLLATEYAPLLNVAVGPCRSWSKPDQLGDLFALNIAPSERKVIRGVYMDSAKDPERTRRGEVLKMFISGRSADDLASSDDEEVLDTAVRDAARFFPLVREQVNLSRVYRWREGMAKSPVGRSRNLAAYRSQDRAGRRVILAGDYMGMPFTEGAAEAGIWASKEVLMRS